MYKHEQLTKLHKFGGFIKICQTAKLNSTTNFPTMQWFKILMYVHITTNLIVFKNTMYTNL